MSCFESLKEFIKVNLNLLNLNIDNSVHIHTTDNTISKPLEYNKEKNLLSINLKKLELADLDKFGEIAKEAVNEGSTLLLKQSQERIVDIKSKEKSADVQQLLTYFQGKIPSYDFAVLRQAIYIKKLFDERANSETIYHLKGEIIKRYGKRGLNICNLYSSGYFGSMIKPLHEETKKQGLDENVFLSMYDVIINEEAFAVFVSGNMSLYDVRDIIGKKITRNIKYGLRTLIIHGIGKNNVSKVIDFISEFEETNPNIKKEIEVKGNIIFAKLFL